MATDTETPDATQFPFEQVTAPLDKIHPNPWNPNKMDERTYSAEMESIATFGFIDPITVRRHPELEDAFQIIDGEHRKRAAEELGYTEVPLTVLDVPEVVAMKLTIVMNETRGQADSAQLGALLAQIQNEDAEGFRTALRYDDTELSHLLSLADQDWSNFNPGDGDPNDDPADPDDEWVSIHARIPREMQEVWDSARESAKQQGITFHEDDKVAAGQLIEILAASYLSLPEGGQ